MIIKTKPSEEHCGVGRNEKEAWACRRNWFSSALGQQSPELETERRNKGTVEAGRPGFESCLCLPLNKCVALNKLPNSGSLGLAMCKTG